MLPQAYVYPAGMRATRDLLRRRLHLVRKRGQLLAHIQMTNHTYNLPALGKRIAYPSNREGLAEHFEDRVVRKSIAVDLGLLERYDALLTDLELYLVHQAKQHEPQGFQLLRSIPGIGKVLAMTILYEIHDIRRFDRVQEFASYARLVRCAKESAGKKHGTSGQDGERAPEVGLLRGGGALRAPLPGGQEAPGPLREEARQGQGLEHPGPQARPYRLLRAPAREGLRSGEVCDHDALTKRGAGEPTVQ